jgi:hypothetical protein
MANKAVRLPDATITLPICRGSMEKEVKSGGLGECFELIGDNHYYVAMFTFHGFVGVGFFAVLYE